MSQYRQDPLSRRWVIIGCDVRASRPNEFVEAATRPADVACPFCEGHESETPPAVAIYPAAGSSWSVRVIPNKYPAVTADKARTNGRDLLSPVLATGQAPGFGRHEVIVESPRHVASLSELTDDEAELVFLAYRDRLSQLKAERQYRYAQIFKNVGPAAGASLEHVHSQLVALPGVPEVVETELRSCREHWQQTGQPLFASLLTAELATSERIVATTSSFAAFCPYASRFPFETWIAPRQANAAYEELDPALAGELSGLARTVIQAVERATGQSSYNYFLHTLPFDSPDSHLYHWHFEILPRLTKVAGFEWGTGCFINPQAPEAAALQLRSLMTGKD